MFDKAIVWVYNAMHKAVARMRGTAHTPADATTLEKYDVVTSLRMVGPSVVRLIDAVNEEIYGSRVGRGCRHVFDSMLERTPSWLPTINVGWLRQDDACRLTSPFMFIVGFIAFIGLSDHGMSRFAFFSIGISLLAYGVGALIGRNRLPSPNPRWNASLLVAALVCFALSPLFMHAAIVGLIPLLVFALSSRWGLPVSLGVLATGVVLFQQGQWTIGLPFLVAGLIGSALTVRTSRIAGLLERNATTIALLLMAFGTLYWVLDIALVGRIPLFTTREGLDPTYTMRSHMLPIGAVFFISLLGLRVRQGASYRKARLLAVFAIVFAAVLMALLGYRTQVLLTLLAAVLVALMWDLITITEVGITAGAIAVIFLIMTVLRTHTTGAHVGFIESVSLRAGLTLDIYDMMAQLGGYLGFTKGQVHMATIRDFATLMPGIAYSPRRYIAVFAGAGGISMTSTLLGPIAVDFGLVGSVVGLGVVGFFMSRLHMLTRTTDGRRRCYATSLYALTLAYLILGIETGLVDYEVLLLFGGAFLYTLYLSGIPAAEKATGAADTHPIS
jgi:oligosaccharide repeat unit polymerase